MRADRLLRLLMLLQRHRRLTAGWLAAELEVSERTVRRDMEALSAAGVPVYTEQGRGGGCVLLEGFTTKATGLTPTEAQALFAWGARESTAQLGLGVELGSALAKIAATAPQAAVREAEALGGVVLADRRRWFAAADEVPWLPALREAAAAGLRIRVGYTSAESAAARPRVLHPVGLVDHSGRWYLVAEHRRRTRTYRVSRITSVRLLSEPVRLTDTRSLAQIWPELRSSFEAGPEPVRARVSLDAAHQGPLRRLLTMALVPGTSIEPDPGSPPDRPVWRFQVRNPQTLAAMAVLCAPELTVLEPAWLIEHILEGADRALAHYGGPGGTPQG